MAHLRRQVVLCMLPSQAVSITLYQLPTIPNLVHCRYASLSDMLDASPAEMVRIMSAYPQLLARDPAALKSNMATVADYCHLSLEGIKPIFRKEPGLFSFNVKTLLSKFSYTTQVCYPL